jgi:hypothetical protein
MTEYATVSQASPLRVLLDSSDTDDPAQCLGSYAPVVNARVAVERFGKGLLVMGRAGAPNFWVAPTLAGTWANYGAGYQVAGYRDMGNGTGMLRGLVKAGAVGTIFTLPSSLCPTATEVFMCIAASGAGLAVVNVMTTGVVQLGAYLAGGTNSAVSLSGISFSKT